MKQCKMVEYARVCIGQGAPQKADDFANEGNPFIRAGSLDILSSGGSLNSLEFISDESAKKNKLKLYPADSVIFAKSGMSATKNMVYKLKHPCYVVSHLAILLPNEKTNPDYLRLIVQYKKPSTLIKDPAYPSISQNDIENFKLPFPPLDDQIRIAAVLTRAETLIVKRKESIKVLDELLKSTFLDIFGDPVRNEKGWEKKELKLFGQIITGNTPPRTESDNYSSDFIEWIKTDNIVANRTYLTVATEYLSEKGLAKARCVTTGALLVACIAGSVESIGRAAIANRPVSFNQQINAIQPNEKTNSLFLYWLFKISKLYIQNHATKGMKKILTKGDFERINMVCPPLPLQNQFAAIVEKIESLKAKYTLSLVELENLYGSLSQLAFKGELDLSKVSVEKESQVTELHEAGMVTPFIEDELSVSPIYSEVELLKIIQFFSGETFNFDSLMNALKKAPFEEMPKYEELKKQIYKMLEGSNPFLSQTFDKVSKEIVLRVIT